MSIVKLSMYDTNCRQGKILLNYEIFKKGEITMRNSTRTYNINT